MRALVYNRYGGPEAMSLIERDVEAPSADEVTIRTHAVGLNPVDTRQREGSFKAVDPYSFPKIAGNELSGVIESVGSEVHDFAPGDTVIARVGTFELGAFAELVTTKAEWVAKAPSTISLSDAAGLPLAGLTAQQALGPNHLNVGPNDRLLITGAAGGVGLIAVQLAALTGADITVTASPQGEPFVREVGAAHVINYRERAISEGSERFNKVFDLVGGDTLDDLFATVEPGGTVVSISGPPTPGGLSPAAVPSRRLLASVAERLMSRKIRKIARAAGASYEFF